MIVELPIWVYAELTGPYGIEVGRTIRWVQDKYQTYLRGADFDSDFDDGKDASDFNATYLLSKKIKRLIDQEAEFMVGKTPEFRFQLADDVKAADGDNPELNKTIDYETKQVKESEVRLFVEKVLKKNKFSSKLMRGCKDCLIGGKVALMVSVVDGKIRLTFRPADTFVYETAEDDVDTITKFIAFECTNDVEDKGEQRWWRLRYRLGEDGHVYLQESIYDGYGTLVYNEGDEIDTQLDRIPVCVIVNGGLSGDMHGESDVDAIEAEDSYYNKMRSQNLDTTRKSMNPIEYIIGASKPSFDGLSRKPGAINDIQPDPTLLNKGMKPDVGKTESSFNYGTVYEDTLENIKDEMYSTLGIPDVSSAKTSGLITSGKGLKALYWPLICRCNEKWTEWEPALEWLAETLIYFASVFPNLKQSYGEFDDSYYYVPFVDHLYPLPEDEAEERELDLKEVGVSRSMKSYLMEWGGPNHKGLSSEEADKEIEQIVKEKRMLEDDDFEEI